MNVQKLHKEYRHGSQQNYRRDQMEKGLEMQDQGKDKNEEETDQSQEEVVKEKNIHKPHTPKDSMYGSAEKIRKTQEDTF